MATHDLKVDDSLDDFSSRVTTFDSITKKVWVAGKGPAVIVMAEMPGISPHVARFARWVRDAGFTVYMPSLFGRDGAVPNVEEGAAVFQRACVSIEFRALAGNQSSPVTHWLRRLARQAHQECGGPGVGAIGMCFTGNFALTMMLEPSMLAPVLSQPALPLKDRAGLEISREELATIRQRLNERTSRFSPIASKVISFAGRSALRPTQKRSAIASSLGSCPIALPTPTYRRSLLSMCGAPT